MKRMTRWSIMLLIFVVCLVFALSNLTWAADNIGALVNPSFATSWTYRSGGVPSPPGGWVLAGWAATAGGPQYYTGAELNSGNPTAERCKWEFASTGVGSNNVIAKEVNWGTYTSVTVTVYCAGRSWSGGAAGTMYLGVDANGAGTQWSDCGTNTTSRTSNDTTWTTISKTISKPGGATTFTVMLNAVCADTKWNCQFDSLTITGTAGSTGTLAGNVKDGNGQNVSGATIQTNTGGYSTTTDASGNYTISGVTAATYNVTASKSGYNSSTNSNVTITANQTTTSNFTITRQTGTISGNVKDGGGANLSGAVVTTSTGGYTDTTDASGNYSIAGVPTGTYDVTASKSGYNSQTQTGKTVSNNATTTVNFTCTRQTGTLTGNVKTNSGSNLSGATVQTNTGGYSGTTDASGNYTISNVATGTYDVMASKSGYDAQTQTGRTVSSGVTTTVNFTLTSNSSILSNGNFEGGFTSGVGTGWTSWVSSWSNPITFADETTTKHGGSHAQRWGRSDRLRVHGGVCQRVNVTSGHTYRITAYERFSSTDTGAWLEMGYDLSGQTTNGEATTVNYTKLESGGQGVWLSYSRDVVATGSTLSVFCKFGQYNEGGNGPSWGYADDLTVSDISGAPTTGTITGNVKNTSAQNISGATVSTNTGGYTTTTNSSGNYTLSNVATGTYTVTASKTGYVSSGKSATVTAGQTTTTNFTLSTSSTNKIGVHIVIGSRTGFGTFLSTTAACGKPCALVKGVDDFGGCYEAKQYSSATLTIGRCNECNGWDMQGLDGWIGGTAQAAADTIYPYLHAVWDLNPSVDVWELCNEWSGNWAWQADYYIAMMDKAEADGHRVALWSCSGGNPPENVRPDIARACARAKSHGNHILALHEYAWDGLLKEEPAKSGTSLVLRYRSLHDYLVTQNADIPVVITEAGENGGGGFTGDAVFTDDMGWYDTQLRQDSYVLGFAAWTLGSWSGANFQTALDDLSTYICAH